MGLAFKDTTLVGHGRIWIEAGQEPAEAFKGIEFIGVVTMESCYGSRESCFVTSAWQIHYHDLARSHECRVSYLPKKMYI